jgi:SAM-dependent methyltransferase
MDFLFGASRKMFSLFQGTLSYLQRLIAGQPRNNEPKSLMVDRLVAEPWYVDSVTSDGATPEILTIVGWALSTPSDDGSPATERFLVNGQAPISVEYPLSRPGVQQVFWQRTGAEMSGFQITAHADYVDGILKVTCLDPATEHVAKGRECWFLADPLAHTNLPDADRRFRVIGNREAEGFLRLGATDAFRIKAAYENVTGKAWQDLSTVLDWGVGCGRVARHLAPSLGHRFHGCDIDTSNVAWCAENLPGTYRECKLEPKLPYADNSFDLIYGISVFTHLRENWEARWLVELHRVLRPGGCMLVTVHGQTAIDFAGLDPSTYKALQDRVEREGLAVTSTNNQLDGFVDHPEEYVNVFHSKQHIQTVWGKHFSAIQQLPGYIFTHDLVVASKQ